MDAIILKLSIFLPKTICCCWISLDLKFLVITHIILQMTESKNHEKLYKLWTSWKIIQRTIALFKRNVLLTISVKCEVFQKHNANINYKKRTELYESSCNLNKRAQNMHRAQSNSITVAAVSNFQIFSIHSISSKPQAYMLRLFSSLLQWENNGMEQSCKYHTQLSKSREKKESSCQIHLHFSKSKRTLYWDFYYYTVFKKQLCMSWRRIYATVYINISPNYHQH